MKIFLLLLLLFLLGCDKPKSPPEVIENTSQDALNIFVKNIGKDWKFQGISDGGDCLEIDETCYVNVVKGERSRTYAVKAAKFTKGAVNYIGLFIELTVRLLMSRNALSPIHPKTRAADMQKLKQFYQYIFAHKFQTFIVAVILMFISMYLLPAPYNTRYLFNLAFRNPTAVCKDDIYSFSASRSGSCSGHGGVKRWIRNSE